MMFYLFPKKKIPMDKENHSGANIFKNTHILVYEQYHLLKNDNESFILKFDIVESWNIILGFQVCPNFYYELMIRPI